MKANYSGKRREMLETPIGRLILRMALPSIVSMLIASIYNLTDTYFVSQLGTSATGAVGIVYPLMIFVQASGLLFGKGSGTLVGRLLGKGRLREAEQVAVHGLLLAVVSLGLLAAAGLIFVRRIVPLLGATEDIVLPAVIYARYIMAGMPFKAGATVLNSILRFQGRTGSAMIGLGCGAVLNIVLDPLLIFGLGFGFAGAGMATLTGELVSFFVLLLLCRRQDSVRIVLHGTKPSAKTLGSILGGGISSFVKNSLAGLAAVLLNNAAFVYGSAAIAAFSIVSRLMNIVQEIYFGLGEGFQAVCSYNYGAEEYRRVLRAFWICIRWGLLLLGSAAAAILFAGKLISVFTEDPQVLFYGKTILRAHMSTLPLLPVCSTGFVMLQGIGQNRRALIVGSGRQGLFLIPLLLLMPRWFGFFGLAMVQPCSDLIAAVLGGIVLFPVLREIRSRSKLAPKGAPPAR